MVDFNPAYLAKHPEMALGRRAFNDEAFKGFLVDLAKLASGDCSGGWVQVSRWRKHWLTKDAKVREELAAHVEAQVFVDEVLMFKARLRDIPGRAWRLIPAPVSGAQLVLHSSALVAIALAVNPPCKLDPRTLVSVELQITPLKKEK